MFMTDLVELDILKVKVIINNRYFTIAVETLYLLQFVANKVMKDEESVGVFSEYFKLEEDRVIVLQNNSTLRVISQYTILFLFVRESHLMLEPFISLRHHQFTCYTLH